MQNFTYLQLNSILEQIQNYNNSFTEYFNYYMKLEQQINEKNKTLKHLAFFKQHTIRHYVLSDVLHLIEKAHATNKTIIENVTTEVNKLMHIINTINNNQPVKDVSKLVCSYKTEEEVRFLKQKGSRLMLTMHELKSNLHISENQILPKLNALLKKQNYLQQKLTSKQNFIAKLSTPNFQTSL